MLSISSLTICLTLIRVSLFRRIMGFMGNGSTYVNVHSIEFPLGEIRGQIEQVDIDTVEEEDEEEE